MTTHVYCMGLERFRVGIAESKMCGYSTLTVVYSALSMASDWLPISFPNLRFRLYANFQPWTTLQSKSACFICSTCFHVPSSISISIPLVQLRSVKPCQLLPARMMSPMRVLSGTNGWPSRICAQNPGRDRNVLATEQWTHWKVGRGSASRGSITGVVRFAGSRVTAHSANETGNLDSKVEYGWSAGGEVGAVYSNPLACAAIESWIR